MRWKYSVYEGRIFNPLLLQRVSPEWSGWHSRNRYIIEELKPRAYRCLLDIVWEG